MSQNKTHWLILTGMPFEDSGGGQRAAQIARTLVDHGNQVTYIYAIHSMEKSHVQVNSNMPNFRTSHISKFCVKRFSEKLYDKLIVLVEVPHPLFLPTLKKLRQLATTIVYERIDPWETQLGKPWYQKNVEEKIWQLADILTATAVSLQEYMIQQTGRSVHLIPNAYNSELFNRNKIYQRPIDLPPGPVIGYVGALWATWFDIDLICQVANKYPNCSVVMIGDYRNQFVGKTPKNVYFLGLKAQSDLPAYLSHFQVGLIPFKVNKLTFGVNPLKVYEYLAMGVPVVSTFLPEVKSIPGVLLGDSWQTFVEKVGLALQEKIKFDEINHWLKKNTWKSRVEKLINLISNDTVSIPVSNNTVSVIILNHNNYREIQSCLNHLRPHKDLLMEIIVVDNNSCDGSREWLEEQKDIILIKNPKNGCASGRNLGVSASTGDYLVFLDSDQFVEDRSFIEVPLKIFKSNSSIGAVGYYGGWIADPNSPVVTTECIPKTVLNRMMKGNFYRTDICYLGTGGMVIPRQVWEKTSGFDERYDPTSFEDTDLSFQIKNLGYQLALSLDIKIKHMGHGTTNQLLNYRSIYKKNRIYFINKWKKYPHLFFSYDKKYGCRY